MNLLRLVTEDIPELLVKIIEFTHIRQKILIQNITNCHSPGFVPKDLEVNEFCNLLNDAIDGHIQNKRLILRGTENIKFHINNGLQIKSVADEHARQLLKENREEYLELQTNRLFDNSLNQRIAAELLRQKQGTATIGYGTTFYREDASNNQEPCSN
jgi:flagellar basal body rod protein FlgB